MTDEKYEEESLSQDENAPDDVAVARPRRPWGLLIVGLLFLALWVWREFGIRVLREYAISQQAEINRLKVENERLRHELHRLAPAAVATSTNP